MRDWSLLKRRLSELRLRPYLQLVANLLIKGRTTREIATMLGCTQQEIAQAIGLPSADAVRKRIARILGQLTERLRP